MALNRTTSAISAFQGRVKRVRSGFENQRTRAQGEPDGSQEKNQPLETPLRTGKCQGDEIVIDGKRNSMVSCKLLLP